MKLPKISIVIPSYNQAQYLGQTLSSITSQNYSNIEIIVMDGGSNDGSVNIILGYADKLSYWVSSPDNGQADAIYRGFERCTGEIIGWINSDDLLLPGCLQKVAHYFISNPDKECVVGGCVIIDSKDNIIKDRLGLPALNAGIYVTFNKLLYWGCGFNQPASFWRRDIFFEVGGFDSTLKYCFDYDMYFRLAKRKSFGLLNECIACFRIHGTSKTSTLQDIRSLENESLWKIYGRYDSTKLTQRVFYYYFNVLYIAKNKMYSILNIIGLYHITLT